MKKWLTRLAVPALAAAVFAACPGQAQAESILVDVGSPTVTGSGPFTWSYAVSVSSSATVQPGDFFVIVDFQGYVPSSNTQPAGWTFSTQAVTGPITGLSGTVQAATDSAAVPNLRWTYTGPTPVSIGPGVSLGTFTADSVYSIKHPGVLVAVDHNHNPGSSTDDLLDVNSQSIDVPAVPLPATGSVGLALLAGLGGAMVLRRRKAMA